MAYITGQREFFGRDFHIGKGALIPRPDSETLVEWILADHEQAPFSLGIDLCCGPGTLGLSLALELKIPLHLVDLSSETLLWCQRNLSQFKLEQSAELHQIDCLNEDLGSLPKADLIVCNPPYIAASAIDGLMPEVRDHEPHLALDGGESGLEFFIALLDRLHTIAKPGCKLYVELGHDQRPQVDQIQHPNWTRRAWRQDLAGISRAVCFSFSEQLHG
jgi:HemK-like putative methylase